MQLNVIYGLSSCLEKAKACKMSTIVFRYRLGIIAVLRFYVIVIYYVNFKSLENHLKTNYDILWEKPLTGLWLQNVQ